MKVALVVPHIFMHRDILPKVIFSPGRLAIDLAEEMQRSGSEVTLFSPGPVDVQTQNITADLTHFEKELAKRNTTYTELLKSHSFTFVTLARQVQGELIADAFRRANDGEFDVVHIYTNEEDIALPFIQFCKVPVVLTHHDPYNFLLKYQTVFPKFAHLNWLSMSYAQRAGMPENTNWVGNIYHGLPKDQHSLQPEAKDEYIAYLGRIIKTKGVHLAIEAVRLYNQAHPEKTLKLKIAGKHYTGHKDHYWKQHIEPLLDNKTIEYVGFIGSTAEKQAFLGDAQALLVPSLFEEPFGMVMIEALACGTPIIGLDSGAIPEIITQNNGILVKKSSESAVGQTLAAAINTVKEIDRKACRQDFETRFTTERMAQEHLAVYKKLTKL